MITIFVLRLFLVIAIVIVSMNTITVYSQNEGNAKLISTLSNNNTKINVVASFYPLYEFTKKIGGDKIDLSIMIPANVEPHNWEPSPQKILALNDADLFIYNGIGFEPFLTQLDKSILVDVSNGLDLIKTNESIDNSSDHLDPAVGYDPHVWLDPILVKNISKTISDRLIKLDPENTKHYQHNTNNFINELDLLDQHITNSLSNCELKDFISFHKAFSYFANRYNLVQHSILGLSPEQEVLPQQINEIISLAKKLNIDTIYSEELKDPRLADVLTSEIPNGRVLLLSPIEGIDKEEQIKQVGYMDKMKKNVENLAKGLKCDM